MSKRKRKKSGEKPISTKLSSSVMLYERAFSKREDLYYLAVKGLMIFLLVFGNIGGFLSAFGMEYNVGVFAVAILLGAVFFSLIYYSTVARNIAYMMFFVVFIVFSVKYRSYINSGFYAVVNEMILTITDYLEIRGGNEYSEFYADRYVTVTAVACFLGLIDAMLMNITMLTRIRRFTSVLISAIVLLVPLYFQREPELLYMCCTMAGLGSMMVMKAGEHYKSIIKPPKMEKGFLGKINSERKQKKRKEYLLSYRRSWKVGLQTMITCFVITIVTVTGMQMVSPKDDFVFGYEESSWKIELDKKIAVAWKYGLEGLMNHQSAGGGIGKGDLSGGASVRPNYETDLILTFAPYTMNTIYLKAYTGVTYGDNHWQEIEAPETVEEHVFSKAKLQGEAMASEVELLSNNYEMNLSDYAAKGKMKVKNVDADEDFLYSPYYTCLDERVVSEEGGGLSIGEENTYVYYPYFGNILRGEPGTGVDEAYLHIPEENYQVIKEFCEQVNPTGTPLQQAAKVVLYFRANIPYTVRPGAVPAGEDAINYFLTENRKGYCSHFASAATLIFRYLGIPARYVEGYAVSAEEIGSGVALEEDYEEYYQGYSEIGETGVVQVEVTDASAHAWVEVYLKDFGWVPMEVTVSDSIDGEAYDVFGQWLGGFFSGDEGPGDEKESDGIPNIEFVHIQVEKINVVIFVCFAGMLLLFGVRTIKKLCFRLQKNETEKLIGEYRLFCNMLRQLEPGFFKCVTHKEQWEIIEKRLDLNETRKDIPEKMESISYGNEKYGDEELVNLNVCIRNLEKQLIKKSTFKEKRKILRYFIGREKN